jgi:class 3 adenylate cyclase
MRQQDGSFLQVRRAWGACVETGAAFQERSWRAEGALLMTLLCAPCAQFRCDEKGFLAICAFGLPGRSHEDGPARGIQTALAIVEAVKRRGGRACCGVTTGHLFCAMVGSQRRSEYTVFGNAINLRCAVVGV